MALDPPRPGPRGLASRRAGRRAWTPIPARAGQRRPPEPAEPGVARSHPDFLAPLPRGPLSRSGSVRLRAVGSLAFVGLAGWRGAGLWLASDPWGSLPLLGLGSGWAGLVWGTRRRRWPAQRQAARPVAGGDPGLLRRAPGMPEFWPGSGTLLNRHYLDRFGKISQRKVALISILGTIDNTIASNPTGNQIPRSELRVSFFSMPHHIAA